MTRVKSSFRPVLLLASIGLLQIVLTQELFFPKPLLAFPANKPNLTINTIAPATAPNDLDTTVAITGTGFAANVTATLGTCALVNVTRVSETSLSGTVPWGIAPGVYPLTVANPDGSTATLTNAFTVTAGIGVWSTGGPYGGQIHDLVMSAAPAKMYAALNDTGIVAYDQTSATWNTLLIDPWPMRVAVDATNAALLYATGQNTLWRTLDSGANWSGISPISGESGVIYPFTHPTVTGIVFAGVTSWPSAAIPSGYNGHFYKSTNSGTNWTEFSSQLKDSENNVDAHVTSMAFHPTDPQQMIAGTRKGNLYLSSDGGNTWVFKHHFEYTDGSQYPSDPTAARIERLYYTPWGANEVWAVMRHPYLPARVPGLYKSTSADLTVWQAKTIGTDQYGHAVVPFGLAFAPGSPNKILAASEQSYVSTDSGDTWASLTSLLGIETLLVDPTNSANIYAGNIGRGVFKSSDGGASWTAMSQGLAGVIPFSLATAPMYPQEVYATTQALGMLKTNNGGSAWQELGVTQSGFPWQGSPIAVDQNDPRYVYYGESCNGKICLRISNNRGTSWTQVQIDLPPDKTGGWSSQVFAVASHPSVVKRVLMGVTYFPPGFSYATVSRPYGGIYLSDDNGATWTLKYINDAMKGVSAFAFDPVDSALFYAATDSGLYRTRDGGANWSSVTTWNSSQPVAFAVTTHPTQTNEIFVSASSESGSSGALYVSQDGGATWQSRGSPNGILLFAPTQPLATLYTSAGNNGLARSTDEGQTWQTVAGLPQAQVWALAASKDLSRVVVYVSTSAGFSATGNQVPRVGNATAPMASGVYRLTSTITTYGIYLPLVIR